jgi:hypothetical protein
LRRVAGILAKAEVGQGLPGALAEGLRFLWRVDIGQPDLDRPLVNKKGQRITVSDADDLMRLCRKRLLQHKREEEFHRFFIRMNAGRHSSISSGRQITGVPRCR